MNNREQMRASNRQAIRMLLKAGYDDIYLKPHTRRKDMIYTQVGKRQALDFYNLFDGFCFFNGRMIWLQIKTNAWPPAEPIKFWIAERKNIIVLAINVMHKARKYIIKVREYA